MLVLAEWSEAVKMEDCCSKENKEENQRDNRMKGGKIDMNTKRIILWIIIALLVLAVIYVVFFRGSGKIGRAHV